MYIALSTMEIIVSFLSKHVMVALSIACILILKIEYTNGIVTLSIVSHNPYD